jgi:hypothetical protein
VRKLSGFNPGYKYFWWKTGRVRRTDLVAVGGTERIGVCICGGMCPQPRDIIPPHWAYEKRLIDRGCVSRVLQELPLYGKDALTLPPKYSTVPPSGTFTW